MSSVERTLSSITSIPAASNRSTRLYGLDINATFKFCSLISLQSLDRERDVFPQFFLHRRIDLFIEFNHV